jgi:hypothetical protein
VGIPAASRSGVVLPAPLGPTSPASDGALAGPERRGAAPLAEEPTLEPGETWRDVRDTQVDAGALGRRGMGYERLDQLAMEHLYGVR